MRLVLYMLGKLQTAFKCGKSYWVDKKNRQPKRYLYCYDHLHDSHHHCLLDSHSVLYTEQVLAVYIAPLRTLYMTLTILWMKGSWCLENLTLAQSHGANLSEFRPMHFVLYLLGGEPSLWQCMLIKAHRCPNEGATGRVHDFLNWPLVTLADLMFL